MDDLAIAAAARARSALDLITGGATSNEAKRRAFVEIAYEMLGAVDSGQAVEALQKSANVLVQKAAAHALGDMIWQGQEASALAESYVASIAELSLLDQLKKYARVLPKSHRSVLIATGYVGNVVTEGQPKAVRHLALNRGDEEPVKSAALTVLTKELALAIGREGMTLFEQELTQAVARASNQAILDLLIDSSTPTVAAGADPLASLRAAIQAAGPSLGYVVAAPGGDAAWLATSEANRGGMGVRGGTFVPGIEVVAVDDLPAMIVIPASRLAITDFGLALRPAGHADVVMADPPSMNSLTPTAAQVVSLWQTNCVGLLAERQFLIGGDMQAVMVEG